MNWIYILLIAGIIEVITIFGRFLFKVSSKEVLIKLMHRYGWKKVIHFHHGFVGLIVVGLAIYLGSSFGVNLGWGLVLSDAIHHFIVLWLIIGDPEFHIIYKNVKIFEKEEEKEDRKIKRFFRNIFR
ncbi:MAG: hypothetical protein KKF50_00905 [Nanoarchaeota archaeon]|nr:hypothetical protein [Nanoarchaeota archaeon]